MSKPVWDDPLLEAEIIALHGEGISDVTKIADLVGCSRDTANRIIKKLQTEDTNPDDDPAMRFAWKLIHAELRRFANFDAEGLDTHPQTLNAVILLTQAREHGVGLLALITALMNMGVNFALMSVLVGYTAARNGESLAWERLESEEGRAEIARALLSDAARWGRVVEDGGDDA